MLKAAKKNRVLRIPDEKAAEYKKLGYTITDMTGKVIYEPEDTAKKASALAAENENLQERLHEAAEYAENGDKKIAALEAENAELKNRVSELEMKGGPFLWQYKSLMLITIGIRPIILARLFLRKPSLLSL